MKNEDVIKILKFVVDNVEDCDEYNFCEWVKTQLADLIGGSK